MPRYVNASAHRRTWSRLRNKETGRTLDLAPGEEAEVEVPQGFEDPYLQAVPSAPQKPRKESDDRATGTEKE